MARTKMALMAALGISAAALLTACDNGPSAVANGKQAAGTQMASAGAPAASASRASSDAASGGVDHRKDPVQIVNGKPVWAASRKYSAENSAQYAFEHHGEDFGAKSLDQYVQKAHAFVEHPPKGTETLTRQNGDMLFYDPKGNVFAVATKDGAPRTMFKPDDGGAYWQQQKDRLAKQASYASRKSRGSDDSDAG